MLFFGKQNHNFREEMKTLTVLLGLLFSSILVLYSQSPDALSVYFKDGKTMNFLLTDQPKLVLSEECMQIITTDGIVEFEIEDFKGYKFIDISNGIPEDLLAPIPTTSISKDKIELNNVPTKTSVYLYNINGIMVGGYMPQEMNTVIIPIESLSNGIYILKIDKTTLKFHKL